MGYYRLRKTSEGQFLDVSDDGNMGFIGANIYALNGTNNITVFNTMYRSADGGRNWTNLGAADWSIRNASGTASVNNKIYLWGGNDYSGALQDSWEFDGTTYTQISAAMSGHNRVSFAFLYLAGHFYSIGGNGKTDVIRSADLVTFTYFCDLPASLQDMGGMSACVWGGVGYVVSGQQNGTGTYPGELWKFDPTAETPFTLLLTDELFGQKWNNIEAVTDALFLVRGHRDGSGNQKGCWYCEGDPSQIANWKRLPYEIPATHANTLLSTGSKIYSFCGNMRNDSWEFERIDV